MTTFAAVLADRLSRDPGQPLITFYDDATGERAELSVTTYANWVAKTASLLVEELDLERGATLLLDLPTHWLGPVFLGAAWTAGLRVRFPDGGLDGAAGADIIVCGPGGLDRWASAADRVPVVAASLLPMGVRFAEALPAGVHDFGIEVWSQPDSFIPWDPPGDDDEALPGTSQADLTRAGAATALVGEGGRLLSEANPASPSGLTSFTGPLARGGSTVWVVNTDPSRWQSKVDSERITVAPPR